MISQQSMAGRHSHASVMITPQISGEATRQTEKKHTQGTIPDKDHFSGQYNRAWITTVLVVGHAQWLRQLFFAVNILVAAE